MTAPKKAIANPKTSAYLNRYRANNKASEFWGQLTKLAEKAGKIDTIDNRRVANEYTGPSTSLNTRPRSLQNRPMIAVRGQGGINGAMNMVRQREACGSEVREHVMEGRAMNAILCPESAAQRRAMTPRADAFTSSSLMIGTHAQIREFKPVDPSETLKP